MFGWKFNARPMAQRSAETSGARDGAGPRVQHRLMIGTILGSNLGWRRVEALQPGDQVLTFDHGMQRVVDMEHENLSLPQPAPQYA